MGLTMVQRHAVTKTNATRYKRADRAGKRVLLDELCATKGWRRDHARKAVRVALMPRVVQPHRQRPPQYGPEVIAALAFCWTCRAPRRGSGSDTTVLTSGEQFGHSFWSDRFTTRAMGPASREAVGRRPRGGRQPAARLHNGVSRPH